MSVEAHLKPDSKVFSKASTIQVKKALASQGSVSRPWGDLIGRSWSREGSAARLSQGFQKGGSGTIGKETLLPAEWAFLQVPKQGWKVALMLLAWGWQCGAAG